MMKDFKQHLGDLFLGKRFHLSCECIIPFDVVGIIIDYTIENHELILHVDTDGKIIKSGENHPNLKIEPVK